MFFSYSSWISESCHAYSPEYIEWLLTFTLLLLCFFPGLQPLPCILQTAAVEAISGHTHKHTVELVKRPALLIKLILQKSSALNSKHLWDMTFCIEYELIQIRLCFGSTGKAANLLLISPAAISHEDKLA